MTKFEFEMLRNQAIEQTKTNHVLHLLLIVFFGLGFITWPLAFLTNNHKRNYRLRKLKREFIKEAT